MKRIFLTTTLILAATVLFAQKPKSMRELRDSIFTVMNLSDENRKAMHDLIAEDGKGRKAINTDVSIDAAEKKQKLAEHSKNIREKQSTILTTEQQEIWRQFAIDMRKKTEATKK